MNRAEKVYLRILADFLNDRETVLDEGMSQQDWKTVQKISKIQRTDGILWKQCRSYLKQIPSGEKTHIGFQNDVCRSVCFETDLREVDRILSEAGVKYTLMKGAALYPCYSEPRLRTMSDIDIIIRKEDRAASHEAMVREGYSYAIPTEDEYVYERDVVEYELHDTMIPEPLTSNVDYHAYFDKVWDHVRPSENPSSTYCPMDESFHFLFLFVHIAKHVLDAGMGFRSYMDLPVMARELGHRMNWPWIRKELEKLELLKFAGICETFCERWFEIGFPIEGVPISDEFYEETTKKILGQGVYGHEDSENRTGYTAKAVKRSGKPYWIVAMGITLRKVFPSYSHMRLIPWYSFINGRPYLLPFAWIYRWIYVLTHKRSTGREVLTETVEKKAIIQKRQKYYSDWGL